MSISEKEKILIGKLRERLGDSGLLTEKYDTDFNLLRWLQGYDWDLEKVVPKLRCHLRLRRAWNLDTILESDEKNSLVSRHWLDYFGGPTKKNNLLVHGEYITLQDHKGLNNSVSNVQLARARTYATERMLDAVMEQERVSGHQSGLAHIMDFQGFKLKSDASFLAFSALCSYLTANYVELFSQVYIINLPSVAYYLWQILRPLLPTKTDKNVIILSSNWRQEILEYIDKSALPVQWGGDIQLLDFQPPQPVPLEFYWSKADVDRHVFKSDLLRMVTVPAGKSERLTIKMDTVEGKVIEWKVVVGSEVWVSVFFTENESETNAEEMEMIFPQLKLFHGVVPVWEELPCLRPGFYVFCFHNDALLFKTKLWTVIEIKDKETDNISA